MKYEKQVARLVDYFRQGEKPHSDFKVGIEFEHIIVRQETGQSVSYWDPDGVADSLQDILNKSAAKPIYEGDHLLGLTGEGWEISTEPGGQFEVAIQAQACLKDLEKAYQDFMEIVTPIFESKGQWMITLGYHPRSSIRDIQILPKQRYDYMFRYFMQNGTLSHNMMKGTAALQSAFDYQSETDFKRKYFIGSALSPILYSLFENSAIFEGVHEKYHNIRQYIWANTDPQRSGIYPFAFDEDLSYRKYAERILNTPMIFMDKDRLEYVGDTPFKDVFDPDQDGDEVIYHALSIVFPDLRLKQYLEFRMMDAVPYPLNFACVALLKGLVYSDDNLSVLEQAFNGIQMEDVLISRENTKRYGLKGIYYGRAMWQWGRILVALAHGALSEEEAAYLAPLEDLLIKTESPRDRFEKIMKEEGILKAIEANVAYPQGAKHV